MVGVKSDGLELLTVPGLGEPSVGDMYCAMLEGEALFALLGSWCLQAPPGRGAFGPSDLISPK